MDIESVLNLLGITGTAQRTYMELLGQGPQSAAFLAKKLSSPRPTIYDALNILKEKGMVISEERNGKHVFSVSNPNHLLQLLDTQEEKVVNAKSQVAKMLPELLKSPRITEPKVTMFSGKEGSQQTMRDLLWYQNITTYTLWPMKKMIPILTPEFLEWHNKRRVSKKISIQAIRKESDKEGIGEYPYLGTRSTDLREIRFLPPEIDLSMCYWIYGDNVAFISAGNESYGFIVHSKEFSETMLLHFRLLWEKAKS